MNKKILAIAFVFAFAIAGLVLMSMKASAAMPVEQCYQMASNKDKALENSLEYLGSGSNINPCNGQMGSYSYYISNTSGITNIRRLFSNGDADGYIGLTRYWICRSNGTAKVNQRIYGPIWARTAWGFWWNFPFDDDPSTWVKDKEICNTMM